MPGYAGLSVKTAGVPLTGGFRATAYLEPVVGPSGLPAGHRPPLTFRTVHLTAGKPGAIPPWNTIQISPDFTGLTVKFETWQTGPLTIQTVGSVFINTPWRTLLIGQVILYGHYRP